MSKEMLVTLLGLLTIVATQLGIPYHPWGVLLFVVLGAAIAVTGFLLRGEALSRLPGHTTPGQRTSPHATFAESAPNIQSPEPHDHQEGIQTF